MCRFPTVPKKVLARMHIAGLYVKKEMCIRARTFLALDRSRTALLNYVYSAAGCWHQQPWCQQAHNNQQRTWGCDLEATQSPKRGNPSPFSSLNNI